MFDELLNWAWGLLAVTAVNTAVLIAILYALVKYGNHSEK